jgi:hypothetical protein
MAKQKTGANKSEEIRKLLKANPKMQITDIRAALAEKNIKVTDALIYFVKGRMKQQRTHRTHFKAAVKVASANGRGDVLGTILKVKTLAAEVGGMKKLKALAEALSE